MKRLLGNERGVLGFIMLMVVGAASAVALIGFAVVLTASLIF